MRFLAKNKFSIFFKKNIDFSKKIIGGTLMFFQKNRQKSVFSIFSNQKLAENHKNPLFRWFWIEIYLKKRGPAHTTIFAQKKIHP